MSAPQGTNTGGFIAKAVTGSVTTYFSDYADLYAGCLPFFGGSWSYASNAGGNSFIGPGATPGVGNGAGTNATSYGSGGSGAAKHRWHFSETVDFLLEEAKLHRQSAKLSNIEKSE